MSNSDSLTKENGKMKVSGDCTVLNLSRMSSILLFKKIFCQSLTKTWYCSKKPWKTWKTCRAACLHRILNMPWHGLICLNMNWLSLNRSEFMIVVRVLNMSHTIQSARSFLKLLKDIIFGILLLLLTILADNPSWIFERVLSNCRVLNMSGLWLF